jgi:hypothetical protein
MPHRRLPAWQRQGRSVRDAVNQSQLPNVVGTGHSESVHMPETIIFPAFFLMISFIVWISVTSWQRRQRLRLLMDFNTRLIERFGSINDFSEFAKTAAGADFLNSMMADAPANRPGERILRSVQTGIVLIALGTGLLLLAWYFEDGSRDDLLGVGVVVLSLGVGFLLASAASYRISRTMGLLSLQPAAK